MDEAQQGEMMKDKDADEPWTQLRTRVDTLQCHLAYAAAAVIACLRIRQHSCEH